MTKAIVKGGVGLPTPKDFEKQKLRKNDVKRDEPENNCNQCRVLKALNFLISHFAPLPAYGLLILICLKDKCLLQHHPTSLTFLLGFIATIELFQVILFCPPRRYFSKSLDEFETVNPKRPEDVDWKAIEKTDCWASRWHAILCTCILYVYFGTVYLTVGHEFASLPLTLRWSIGVFVFVVILLLKLVIYKLYQKGFWMTGCTQETTLTSVSILFAAFIWFILSPLCPCPTHVSSFIGTVILMCALLHTRLTFFYYSPPKFTCMLSMKSTRPYIREYYFAVIQFIMILFCALSAVVLSSDPTSECSPSLPYWLIAFCFATPFAWLLYRYLKRIAA